MSATLSIRIVLSDEAVERLRRPVNGQGGFQSFLRSLQRNLDGHELTLTPAAVKRIANYVERYGDGGFQGRLAFVLDELRELARLLRPMAA
jgi:hypothetical protein